MSRTDYEALGAEVGRLVAEKQRQYGDSFGRAGDVMRALYPGGVAPHQLDDALAVVRVVDKLFRVAQRGEDGRDPGGESPWRDIAGYGLLGASRDDARAAARERSAAPLPTALRAANKIAADVRAGRRP